MKIQRGFGASQQNFHPRARDTLQANKRQHRAGFWGVTEEEMTANYFVPSFSIRRHLYRSEEGRWQRAQKEIGNALGRHYQMMHPATIAVKSIEQQALIKKIRESGDQPSAAEMRDVAYNVRDGLTEALAAAPDPLEVGLGRLAVFGIKNNKLGFTVDGWKGWRARYSLFHNNGEMTAPGALMVENQIALGSLAL